MTSTQAGEPAPMDISVSDHVLASPRTIGRPRLLGRIRPQRRLIATAIAGVLTFSVVYGLAASLSLTSDSLGAATTTVAACQAATLNASYTSTYSATAPGYTVGTVTVTGLAATCYSKPYRITLSGAAGASL